MQPAASQSACTQLHMLGFASSFERVERNNFDYVFKKKVLLSMFCCEVLTFKRASCCALGDVLTGIYPKAGLKLDYFSSGQILCELSPLMHIYFSLSRSPCPRDSEFILQCATVAARETWTRVGGRYFGMSGSVVPDCAGPLSVLFGVVMQSGVGEVSRDHGGTPHWEEGTNYPAYMWPADW